MTEAQFEVLLGFGVGVLFRVVSNASARDSVHILAASVMSFVLGPLNFVQPKMLRWLPLNQSW